jgi:hypothetical protein
MVNLYGSPRIVAEYPKLMTPSTLDNNTFKVEEELTDNAIIAIFAGEVVPTTSVIADEQSLASEVLEEATEVSAGTKTYSGRITSLKPNQIFVFGSNEGGSQGQAPTHGAGAAKLAKDKFGAIQGQSRGVQGQSYAIVTKKFYDVKRSSTPEEITTEIKTLYNYARNNPGKEFLVSDYSETNLNGYSGQEMADMFSNAGPIPSNIVFNENFEKLVSTSAEPVIEEEVTSEQPLRTIKVNQFNITIQPDGKMFFDNGKEVTDQTIKNKVNIRKELQDGTLRVSTYNNSEYFVLLDGRILGSGKTNLGKETVGDPKIKEQILDKAVLYRKTC